MRFPAQLNLRCGRARRRGFMMLDALLGLFLIVAIAAALGLVVSNQRRAAIATANGRDAVRRAEAALISLQAGQPAVSGVDVKQIDAPSPRGWVWVRATGQSGTHRAELIGLVPISGGSR